MRSKPLLLLPILVLWSLSLHATHAEGLELFFKWKSDSTYEISALMYRNCGAGAAGFPPSFNARVFSPSLSSSFTSGYTTVNLTRVTLNPSSQTSLYDVAACMDTLYCLEQGLYRGTWTASAKARDWTIAVELCCFAPGIVNLSANYIHAEAGLNNLDFEDSTYQTVSPIFHNPAQHLPPDSTDLIYNPAIIATCQKNPVNWDNTALNLQNDEIRYSFFVPQDASGVNQTYINGFSFSNPIPTTAGITLDSLTGNISFIADTAARASKYLLGLQATAYDYDTVLIGGVPVALRKQKSYVKRNLLFIIEDTASCAPDTIEFYDTTGVTQTPSIILGCSETEFNVFLSPRIDCSSIDSNGSHISLVNSVTQNSVGIQRVSPIGYCSGRGLISGFRVYLDSAMTKGLHYLTFKTGSDGNTMFTSCGDELVAGADTLMIQARRERGSGIIKRSRTSDTTATINLECGRSYFSIWITEQVKCLGSVDFSDAFGLYRKTANGDVEIDVNSAYMVDCRDGYSQQMNISCAQMPPGEYRFALRQNQTRLVGYCDNPFDSSEVNISVPFRDLDDIPNLKFCEERVWDTTLVVPNDFVRVSWKLQGNMSAWGSGNSHRIHDPGMWTVEGFYQNESSVCAVQDIFIIKEEPCPVGEDENELGNFKVFPNPATNSIFISIPHKGLSNQDNVQLLDIHGRVIAKTSLETDRNNRIDVESVPSGLYLVRIYRGNEVLYQEKVIIER